MGLSLVIRASSAAGIFSGGDPGGFDFSWVPEPGQWAEVGLNTLEDVQGPEPSAGDGFSTGNGFMAVWQGSSYAPNFGIGGSLGSIIYIASGGHQGYRGNDAYGYDIEMRQCFIIRETYNPITDPNEFGEYPDGSIQPPHVYDSVQVFPDIGDNGAVFLPTTYDTWDETGTVTQSHLLDLESGIWSRGPNYSDFQGGHPSSIWDHARKCYWMYRDGNPSGPLVRVDQATLTPTSFTGNAFAIANPHVMCYDSRRDHLILFTQQGALSTHPHWVYRIDLSRPNTAGTRVASYPNSPPPEPNVAFAYVEEIDRYIAWSDNTANGGVYYLDPNNFGAGFVLSDTSTLAPPDCINNPYSKYRYIPQIQCLIGISNVGDRAWAYRVLETPP